MSEKTKSELFKELLSPLNSGRVELLDEPRLKQQILALERRTGSSGRDTYDHPPNGHHDVINAAAGAIFLAQGKLAAPRLAEMTECLLERSSERMNVFSCFVFGGDQIPGDFICQRCPGRASAFDSHDAHLRAVGNKDLRRFVREDLQPNAHVLARRVRAFLADYR